MNTTVNIDIEDCKLLKLLQAKTGKSMRAIVGEALALYSSNSGDARVALNKLRAIVNECVDDFLKQAAAEVKHKPWLGRADADDIPGDGG